MKSTTYHQKTIIVEGDGQNTTDLNVIRTNDNIIFLRQDSPPDEEGNYRVNMIQVSAPQQAAELIRALVEITTN